MMMNGQQGWLWVSESDGDDSDDGKDVRNEPPKKKLKGKCKKLGGTKGGKSKLADSPTPKAATQLAAADKSINRAHHFKTELSHAKSYYNRLPRLTVSTTAIRKS